MTETQTGCVRVTVNQQDTDLTFEQLGVTIEATDNEILSAVRGVLSEQIVDQNGEFTFAVRRATNTGMVYVYPKPGFG